MNSPASVAADAAPQGDSLAQVLGGAADAAARFAAEARGLAASRVMRDGRLDAAAADREQRLVHGGAILDVANLVNKVIQTAFG